MAGNADYLLPGFSDAVAYFERTWVQFQNAFANFLAVESEAANAGDSNYFAVKKAAEIAGSTADGIRSGIDTVKGWLDSVGLNGLGFIQAVPAVVSVGAITAAAASLAYLIPKMQESYYKYSLVQSGQLSPETAYPYQPGVMESSSNIVKWIVIGAAIYFLAPVLVKQLEKK